MDLPSCFTYEYEQGFYQRDTGGKTRYIWLHPKREKPKGFILFSHGMGFDAVYPHLNFFRQALENGYQVFSYDLDGHGAESSTHLHSKNLTSCLENALQFVTQRTSDPIRLAGMSLGGRISLEVLSKNIYPQITHTSLLAMPLQRPSYLRSFFYESFTLFSRSFHKQWSDYGLKTIPAFGPFGRDQFPVRTHGHHYILETLKYIDSHDPVEIAKKCNPSVPITLKYGKWDGIAPPSQGLQLHQSLPQSSFSVILSTHLSFPAKASIC